MARGTTQRRFAALALTLATVVAVHAEPVAEPETRFDGQKVVRVEIESADDLRFMQAISPDMWSHHAEVGAPADFRVDAESFARLDATNIDYGILIDDLQALIDAERARLAAGAEGPRLDGDFFADYRPLNEVSAYLDELVALRPDLASRVHLGTSIEGRPIDGISITSGTPGDRPAVLIHGCQHAREWITVMVNLYIADTFIRNYDSDPIVRDLIDRVEFIVVPVVNPDGYEYTWTTNRLWRKNRRGWWGVDLNRNWAVGWGGTGSSGLRFTEIYRGEAPFSEPETSALRDYFLANPHIVSHIDFHSYSQLILEPWGFTPALPPAYDFFEIVAGAMADEIEAVHGKVYVHGPTWSTIYPASGVAQDWTYGATGRFSMGFELRDTGQFGFLLPPDQIIPNGEEIVPAMITLGEFVSTMRPALGLDVDTFVAGEPASMTATNSTPGTQAFFGFSLTGPGANFTPTLGVTVDLQSPLLAGVVRSDAFGVATLNGVIPDGTAGLRVWLQAVQYGVKSDVVLRIVRP